MTKTPSMVLLACALLAAGACSREAPDEVESEAPVPVTTAPAQIGRITAVSRVSGLVTPAPGADLVVVAPEGARVLEIPKAEGDTVRRGELLVRFEIPSTAAEVGKQKAEIGRAEARITNARAAQARARDLFDRGVAARKEVEDAARELADAEADLASAGAAAAAADLVAARSIVRATFDGVVAQRSHNPGDLVEATAADAVLRVIDPRRLEVQAAVPLADAPHIKVGAAARLTGLRDGSAAVSLKVVSRPVMVDPGTASVPVRLTLPASASYAAGTPVQLDIDTDVRTGVILVPAAAVVHEGEEAAVFVVSGDTANRRAVKLGAESDEHVEVISGIKAGETVIVSGQNGLPDGARVTVIK